MMFALVDCDNFFASCERISRPELKDKPVVVLSNNDGCIIARSNEAKALGIPMAAPVFQYRHIIEAHQVVMFSGNFSLYNRISNQVMRILADYSPDVEHYSIDEAFMDMHGFDNWDLKAHFTEMRSRIDETMKIPVSVGVAPTKTLAKVASHIAKKFPEHHSGVYVMTADKIEKALKWLPIGDVWGIGRRISKRLQAIGVKTAYDFTKLPENFVLKEFSVLLLRLQKELKGQSVLSLSEARMKQSISFTRTFTKEIIQKEEIAERITNFAMACSERLRRQGTYCKTVTVFLATNYHKKFQAQYYNSFTIRLAQASDSSIVIGIAAGKALEKIFMKGFAYKRAGVIIDEFVPENGLQINLFEGEDHLRHKKLMTAMDTINKKLGMTKLKLASQGLESWRVKEEDNAILPHTIGFIDSFVANV